MRTDSAKKTKVLIAQMDPANKDTAAYNRFLSIVKMVQASFEFDLIIPERAKINNRLFGGIISRLRMIHSLIKAFSQRDNKRYNYILFLTYIDPFLCFISWLLAKPKKIKMAIERNEFPSVLLSGGGVKKTLYKYCVLTWHYHLFDVLFLMTDELIDFYGKHTRKGCLIQKLPMTVDFSRFENIEPHQDISPYIFYAGSLNEDKDGVESLIHTFKIIADKEPDIFLKIAGGTKDGTQEKKLMGIIKTYYLQERIQLLGYIKRDEIPRYLCAAKIVVLPRPDSLQARGGFPTKLGEYLASGKPVIVTRVGEIPKYLSEDESFFISPKEIVKELTEKIAYILTHYEQALEVADRGKMAAKRYFSLEANQESIKHVFGALK